MFADVTEPRFRVQGSGFRVYGFYGIHRQSFIQIAVAGFWSTILEYFFLVPVPLRNHYEIKVYTFFSLVT